MVSNKFHIRASSCFLDLQTIRALSLVVTNGREVEILMWQKRYATVQAATSLRLTMQWRTKQYLVSK